MFQLENQPVMIMGTEGGERRWSLWMFGEFELDNTKKPRWRYHKSGAIDWGTLYGASCSEQPIDGRRLLMGTFHIFLPKMTRLISC